MSYSVKKKPDGKFMLIKKKKKKGVKPTPEKMAMNAIDKQVASMKK